MSSPSPRTVEQYLELLRSELQGADPALVQDALYDADDLLAPRKKGVGGVIADEARSAGEEDGQWLALCRLRHGLPEIAAEAALVVEVLDAENHPHRRAGVE